MKSVSDMAMLDGLRVVFLEALSFVDATEMKRLVVQWNEQCEEVYKYKNALIAEERFKAKSEVERLQEEIETFKDTNEHLAVLLEEAKQAYANYEETTGLKQAKQEVAREIFAEIERLLNIYTATNYDISGNYNGLRIDYDVKYAVEKLKKKYTEEKT